MQENFASRFRSSSSYTRENSAASVFTMGDIAEAHAQEVVGMNSDGVILSSERYLVLNKEPVGEEQDFESSRD